MGKKILFIHSGSESFINLDKNILSDLICLIDYYYPEKFPFGFIKLWFSIRHVDFVFCWFASWNSFWSLLFARIQNKKSILIIGGYDLANLPEARYGHMRGGLEKWVSTIAIKLANVLITNSFFSKKEALQNIKNISKTIHVIYHGVPDTFGSLSNKPNKDIVLTVGKVDWPNLKRKGLELFVQSAKYLPETSFILVGAWADKSINYLHSIATPNVIFTGQISNEELMNYYRSASVYVQVSYHEGFGMSVAESMLAGCIPVISKAGALPEVVGINGIFIDSFEPTSIADSIKKGLGIGQKYREDARKWILTEFPMIKRTNSFKTIINNLFNDLNVD